MKLPSYVSMTMLCLFFLTLITQPSQISAKDPFSEKPVSEKKVPALKDASGFKLQGVDGKMHKLADYAGKMNVVIVISRANWCPYCMAHVKSLQKSYKDFKSTDTEVLVIFREEQGGLEGLKEAQKTTGAEFPLLLDLNSEKTAAYKDYGVYIVDKKGKIRFNKVGKKTGRILASDILNALDQI